MVERIHKGFNIVSARLSEDQTPAWIRITEYVLALCLILQCRTFWMHLVDVGKWTNRGVFVVAAVALVLLATHNLEGRLELKISREHIKDCIIVILYIAVWLLVVPYSSKAVLRCTIILVLFLVYFFSNESKEKAKRLLIKYKNIMVVLAAISVVCWVLFSLLHFLPYNRWGDIYITWTNTGEIARRSHILYLYSEMQWFIVHYITRNTSIFVEGPMYCYCLSIALFVELFAEDKSREAEREFCTWSLLLAQLTVLTTVGFIYLTVIGAAHFLKMRLGAELLDEEQRQKNRKAIRKILIVAAVLCAIFLARKLSVMSGSTRVDDIWAGFHAWLSKPWFGSGFENQNYINKFVSNFRLDNLGYSNSPGLILANGGVYLAVIYIYAWVRIVRNGLKRKTLEALIVTGLYMLMFTVTIIPYQYLTMFFLLVLVNDYLPYTVETPVELKLKPGKRGASSGE